MPIVFIGFGIICLPKVIFSADVALNVNYLTASTPPLHHKCVGGHFFRDRYSNFLHDHLLSNHHMFHLFIAPGSFLRVK